jgi:hypothetical protein
MNLDIPDFLKLTPDERRAAWQGRKLTKPRPGSTKLLRVEDAQTRAFRRELERQKKAKQDARFALLRERAALAKKQAVR